MDGMKFIYRICGKISLAFYLFVLYKLWHMCQYGGLRSHILSMLIGSIGFVISRTLWLIAKRSNGKEKMESTSSKKIYYIEVVLFILTTLFFGGKIFYSAIPYNGALSWKVDEWMQKKAIVLEHNNIIRNGMEGIILDLDKKLDMPEELYVTRKCQVRFDKEGNIQSIYAFLYGKDKSGEKRTYLIDYDANKSEKMIVSTDINVNVKYEEGMRLSPMLEILKNADWISQVQMWSEHYEASPVFEILYTGKAGFCSPEGIRFIAGDADGDGREANHADFNQLPSGSEVTGYEMTLRMPDVKNVEPVRYMMEPEYITQAELDQENIIQQSRQAAETEGWITDSGDGTMYFFLDRDRGWRLVITDAVAGSRFYVMEKTIDGGVTWECINDDPFMGQIGVAEGLVFYEENIGVAGLAGASQSHSALYLTRDGGRTFEKIELPMNRVTELPETAEDYDYLCMPQKEDGTLSVTVTSESAEKDGLIFQSTDDGVTWEYKGVTQEEN